MKLLTHSSIVGVHCYNAVMIVLVSKFKNVWKNWLKEESLALFRLSWPVVSCV